MANDLFTFSRAFEDFMRHLKRGFFNSSPFVFTGYCEIAAKILLIPRCQMYESSKGEKAKINMNIFL